ncbi:MAG: S41 family peptidase [Saprospiraceae bacterium]|nr:S41 family peptidase [Saprospiraceae bacterium]
MLKQLFFPILGALCCCVHLQAQSLSTEFKQQSIDQISALLQERYVFPEVATATATHLKARFKAGAFDAATDLKSFANALTAEAQAITHDKHLRVRTHGGNAPSAMGRPDPMTAFLDSRRGGNAGFAEVKMLPDNIGYLDLRGFAPPAEGRSMADHSMALLASADAIIIDLRKNGGGSPAMVQYLCSYFFDQKVHLNSLYYREGDRTEEFWTMDQVGGIKMPEVPLFILTSDYTFSGAEEFSYNMQSRKRVTLVGETTGGGANPGGMVPVNDQLAMFIPGGRAINPVTKTNWEGVGVVPEVKVAKEEALDKAMELAGAAAAAFRKKVRDRQEAQVRPLFEALANYPESKASEAVLDQFKSCVSSGLMSEEDINRLGYDYMMGFGKPQTAEHIFWCNTRLFPASANAYDSYGEALMANGSEKDALAACQKAVELAEKSNHPDKAVFLDNLKKLENHLDKK